jgi:hypothetical protein
VKVSEVLEVLDAVLAEEHSEHVREGAAKAQEALTRVEQVVDLPSLAVFNEARHALAALLERAKRARSFTFDEGSTGWGLHSALNGFPGSGVLGRAGAQAVLAQELWLKSAAGQTPLRADVRSGALGSEELEDHAVLAGVICSGPHVLVRGEESRVAARTRELRLIQVFKAPGSEGDVLLVPVGVVGMLSGLTGEVVLVGELNDDALRRAEAVSVLSQGRSGASLKELFEAAGEL